ncbi:dynein regulatory complex subunit 7 isoform X1 [Microplitis mediator]|uniref:dynein regulatory complex subunit 7 isoform X1 n=2 Tax=Microplitis mediator TaxID=375433 RepID=UPI0025564FE7|nr:dynein regulatory complex subunit 7 isoform X1 [Microplitis mediator]
MYICLYVVCRQRQYRHPEVIRSPTWVLNNQRGNSFEYANFLASLLLGQGYNAYVVSGYASREQTTYDTSMNPCPYMPATAKTSSASEIPPGSKYQLKPPPQFQSKLLIEIEQERLEKIQKEEADKQDEQRKLINERERLPADEFWGHRMHAWVVVLPEAGGPRRQEVLEPFFIEPSSGQNYPLDNHQTDLLYHGVESIWNDRNYWVNMQTSTAICSQIDWTLRDNSLWESMLPGESAEDQEIKADNDDSHGHVDKHLDMPTSYVEQIDIQSLDYERRFPNGRKTMMFKKTKVELFAPYVQMDGLIEKITVYEDYECKTVTHVYEKYSNRGDKLVQSTYYDDTAIRVDLYNRGRPDAVKEHHYTIDGDSVTDERTLEFYDVVRSDGLSKIKVHPLYLTQHYVGRKDFLYYRNVEFLPQASTKNHTYHREISKITKKLNRNNKQPATKDIAIREYCISENKIELKYHYKDDDVTRATRTFIKPADRGDRLVFKPEITYGYNPDPLAPLEKSLDLFNLLETQLKEEEQSVVYVRDAERLIHNFLKLRKSEHGIPKLTVSEFDRNRNDEAKAAMFAHEEMVRKESERQVEEEIDYLQPYLARLGNPDKLTKNQTVQVQQECLNDFKETLVNRANSICRKFQVIRQNFEELQSQLAQADDLSKEEEERLIADATLANFEMHTLDVRLKRHVNLSSARYQSMVNKLKAHPRLASLSEQ